MMICDYCGCQIKDKDKPATDEDGHGIFHPDCLAIWESLLAEDEQVGREMLEELEKDEKAWSDKKESWTR